MQTKPGIKLLAVGSPYPPDDIAFRVLDKLQQLPVMTALPAQFGRIDAPLPQLLNEPFDCPVIFLDAMQANLPPASVRRFDCQALAALAPAISSHHLGLVQTLQLLQNLGKLPATVGLFGIEVDPQTITLSDTHIADIATQIAGQINQTLY